MKLLEVFLAAVLPSASLSAYCHGSPTPNAPRNLHDILTAPPKFVRETPNGKLFEVSTGNNVVSILHVWGTPYEMGFTHGRLLQDKVIGFIDAVYDYMIDEITHELNDFDPNLPPEFVEDISIGGINWALDRTINLTAPYTADYFNNEIRGLADATGLPFEKIQRIHMLGNTYFWDSIRIIWL